VSVIGLARTRIGGALHSIRHAPIPHRQVFRRKSVQFAH
jgi:hypothetical protein